MVRVIVAEDHALVRQGLSLLLASAGGFSVVAETGLGSEAIDLARTLQPDLLLLDLALQDRSGIEVAQAVRHHSPATHIMVVTGNVYPGSVTQAFAAGVGRGTGCAHLRILRQGQLVGLGEVQGPRRRSHRGHHARDGQDAGEKTGAHLTLLSSKRPRA